ncbi:MAG: BON domain-containing protein [Planctomycetes bacterium]|nr:BON domain-containing protein [Planctomycetota bacterium]
MNDRDIEAMVHTALISDGRLSSQSIEVSVSHAIVYLNGRVQSYRRKLLAQRLASSFRECRDVINQLEVEPTEVVSDDVIAKRTSEALSSHADIDKHTLTVSVTTGYVTLRGTAGTEWERMMAEDVALAVRGVRGVKNLILVDTAARQEDQALCNRVQAALDRAHLLEQTHIQTAVDQGVIVLSGTAPSLALKELAYDIARRHSLRHVRNEIVVSLD